ncbi:hypothetical protein B0H14DRAFT_3454844 [Mycena olivaceomarginata]|nr:hypothetical protein B0H14DRAFT_3454844 [Mycena olivaceomarginata]
MDILAPALPHVPPPRRVRLCSPQPNGTRIKSQPQPAAQPDSAPTAKPEQIRAQKPVIQSYRPRCLRVPPSPCSSKRVPVQTRAEAPPAQIIPPMLPLWRRMTSPMLSSSALPMLPIRPVKLFGPSNAWSDALRGRGPGPGSMFEGNRKGEVRRIAKARGTQRKTFDMRRLALRAKMSHSYLWNRGTDRWARPRLKAIFFLQSGNNLSDSAAKSSLS